MNESEVAIYLGQKGYSIKKENMEIKEQLALRKDLMVKPFVPKSSLNILELFLGLSNIPLRILFTLV